MPTPPPFAPPGSLRLKLTNALVRANVIAYRSSGGRVGGKVSGAPVLLLEHVGRKSGRQRTVPLIYTKDGDDLVIVASRAGSDFTPAWWLNLRDSPTTTVQVGREQRTVVAREATGDERERLWPRVVESYGDYETYRGRTDRVIPVVVLSPAE